MDDGTAREDGVCDASGGVAAEQDERCVLYTRLEAVVGVDPVMGTLKVECRPGFVRGVTSFGALDSSSAVSVTRTESTPTS